MITKFDTFLNETNITDVVYHRTYIGSLFNIIKTGKILLSTSMGTGADMYSKKPYFLSLGRTKNLKFGYSKNSNVTIEFDGKALKTKYKGKSIDYWQWDFSKDEFGPGHSAKRRTDSDEYEDRIFSNDPYMLNLDKYIKWIDIMIPDVDKDKWNESYTNTLKEYVVEMKKINSPLLKKIRIFESVKDFDIGKKWVSINNYNPSYEPDKDFGRSDKYFGQLDFRLLNRVITVLLMGDKVNDKEYLKKEIQKYYDKFIKLGAEKLKNVTEDEINSLIWSIQQKSEWDDVEFVYVFNSDIHGLGKSSNKSEITYEILKLLSDEIIKYKVTNIKDLIDVKMGKGKKSDTKKADYSKIYGFVYKRYDDRYELVDNDSKNTYFLKWTHLKKDDIEKIYDLAYKDGYGYDVRVKNIINYIFNTYNIDKAKDILSKITDTEYKLIDLIDKLVYKEITEKDYIADDIGHRSCWMYVDNGNWVSFIQDNVSEKKFKEIYSKVRKLAEDKEVKIRFIWAVTERLLGEEKTLNFFDENNLIPLKDELYNKPTKKYLINIGEKKEKEVYV